MTWPEFAVSKSIMWPGVQTIVSAPFFMSTIWSLISEPLYVQMAWQQQTSMFMKWQNYETLTWRFNTFKKGLRGRWSLIWWKTGRRNAIVFPEPVFATPMTSRPDMITGIAWAWASKKVVGEARRCSVDEVGEREARRGWSYGQRERCRWSQTLQHQWSQKRETERGGHMIEASKSPK